MIIRIFKWISDTYGLKSEYIVQLETQPMVKYQQDVIIYDIAEVVESIKELSKEYEERHIEISFRLVTEGSIFYDTSKQMYFVKKFDELPEEEQEQIWNSLEPWRKI